MKNLKISNNDKMAIVDDEDFPYLSRFAWCMRPEYNDGYIHQDRVVTFVGWHNGKSMYASLGHFLVDNRDNNHFIILHKNGNPLDFRKSNLYCGGFSQKKIMEGKYNFANKDPTSRFKGVMLKKRATKRPWTSAIRKDRVRYHLGSFYTEEEAARAYDEKARELYGELAYQNFPDKEGVISNG